MLGLLARGLINRQIAAALGVSVKTVGAHVEHIYIKAGVRSRAAATLSRCSTTSSADPSGREAFHRREVG